MAPAEKLTILFLAANPAGMAQVKLDEEMRSIDAVLRSAEFRDRFELHPHWAVRAGDLEDLLLRYKPHILHFSGHGSQAGEIVLKDDSGGAQAVDLATLAALLHILKDNLRCVVLNACYTQAQAEAIAGSIDFVVGMSRAIADKAAISFATGFYRGLGYGRTIQTAFDLGCVAIGLASGQGVVYRAMRPPAAMSPPGSMEIPHLVALRSDAAQVTMLDDSGPELIDGRLAVTQTPIIDAQEMNELFVLLHQAQLGDAEWASFYQASLPEHVTPLANADRWQMLKDLGTRPVQKPQNRLPILDFVEHAFTATHQRRERDLLRTWSNDVARRVGVTPKTTVATSARQLAYVIVVIRPHLGSINDSRQPLYQLQIFLWREGQSAPAVWQADDQPRSLEEIRSCLDRQLRIVEQAAQFSDGVKRVVEFVVPVELLSADLERWERRDEWRRGTFGQVFPVTVRPLERVFRNMYMEPGTADEVYGEWRARWQAFSLAAGARDMKQLNWLPGDDYDTIFDRLQEDAAISCVGLERGVTGDEGLRALIASGVPIALWLRGSDAQHPGCDLKASAAASARRLAELREWALEARIAAKKLQDGQPPLGHHLALLWDDPERIPEETALPGMGTS